MNFKRIFVTISCTIYILAIIYTEYILISTIDYYSKPSFIFYMFLSIIFQIIFIAIVNTVWKKPNIEQFKETASTRYYSSQEKKLEWKSSEANYIKNRADTLNAFFYSSVFFNTVVAGIYCIFKIVPLVIVDKPITSAFTSLLIIAISFIIGAGILAKKIAPSKNNIIDIKEHNIIRGYNNAKLSNPVETILLISTTFVIGMMLVISSYKTHNEPVYKDSYNSILNYYKEINLSGESIYSLLNDPIVKMVFSSNKAFLDMVVSTTNLISTADLLSLYYGYCLQLKNSESISSDILDLVKKRFNVVKVYTKDIQNLGLLKLNSELIDLNTSVIKSMELLMSVYEDGLVTEEFLSSVMVPINAEIEEVSNNLSEFISNSVLDSNNSSKSFFISVIYVLYFFIAVSGIARLVEVFKYFIKKNVYQTSLKGGI